MKTQKVWSRSTVLAPLALAGVLAIWSCRSDSGTEPDPSSDLPQANSLVVVTEPATPVASPGQASSFPMLVVEVSYVSLAPGSIPEGDSVEVRNATSGVLRGASMVEGGVDAIPIPASVGDELEITILRSGLVIMRMMVPVPVESPPRVVRTKPPRGRTRVPLNSVIVITATEPLSPGTVTAQTARVLQNAVPVPATVSLSSDGLRVVLIPEQPLQPVSTYVISVSTAVRDVAGDPFASEYTSSFTTGDPPPAEGTIVFWQGPQRVMRMNADGTGIVSIAPSPALQRTPTISPNGRWVAFYSDIQLVVDGALLRGFIHVIPVSGATDPFRALLHTGSEPTRPAWSPDGSKIAFASDRDDPANRDIYLVTIDGTGVSRLTTDPATDRRPWWSPDGNRIVFASDRGGNFDLYVMNADGSNVARLTTHPADDDNPSWSPDGSKIAFHSQRDSNYEIYVMDADGTNVVRLTDHHMSNSSPAWSPDGTRIVFQSNRVATADLWTMNPDGTGLVNLTTHTGIWFNGPSWGP